MNEQELNKKLAEWVGWDVAYNPDTKEGIDEGITNYYINPEGKAEDPPIFPESLDACFEWLVPKAIDEIMAIHDRCSSDVAYGLLFKWWLRELELIIPDAALALCLSIEKLINGE